jgi:hypothetical protein
MSFFDNINPFKKKDEFGFAPLDNPPVEQQPPNLDQGHNFDTGNFAAAAPPQMEDHRMTMPLGESIRQQRTAAMYGETHEPYHEPEVNPLKKDLELISAKLDYLRASLDAVNQRLVNLEHVTRQQMESRKW